MPAYGLDNTILVVKQGNFRDAAMEAAAPKTALTDQVIDFSQATIARKDKTIDSLRQSIAQRQAWPLLVADLRNEVKTLLPDVQSFTAAQSLMDNATSPKPDTVMLVYAKFSRRPTAGEKRRIERWLRNRTKSKKIKLLVD